MTQRGVLQLLESIVTLLRAAQEAHWIPAIEQQVAIFNAVQPGTTEYQDAIRGALKLYGGMGSFQDLVLHNERGLVTADQADLARLRQELFAVLREQLS